VGFGKIGELFDFGRIYRNAFGDFADSGVAVGAEYLFRPFDFLKLIAERVLASARADNQNFHSLIYLK